MESLVRFWRLVLLSRERLLESLAVEVQVFFAVRGHLEQSLGPLRSLPIPMSAEIQVGEPLEGAKIAQLVVCSREYLYKLGERERVIVFSIQNVVVGVHSALGLPSRYQDRDDRIEA